MTRLTLAVAMLGCAGLLAAQGLGTKTIVGRLWIGSQPGVHFAVVLENEYGNPIAQTMSDSEGRFTFDGLNGGQYKLSIQADGFVPLEQGVDAGAAGEQISVTLFLHRRQERVNVGALGGYSLSAKAERSYAQATKLLGAGQYRQAIPPLTATVAAAPQFAAGYVALGNAYWATRDRGRAETEWRKALALDPQQADAAIGLARLDNDRRQWKPALALLDGATSAAHGAWPWRLERGRAEFGLGQWAAAGADLEASLPSAGQANPAVYVLLSNLALKAGQLPRARGLLEDYLRAAPKGEFAPRARAIVQQMNARGVPEPPAATPR